MVIEKAETARLLSWREPRGSVRACRYILEYEGNKMHVPILTADLLAGWLLIALFCTVLGAYLTLRNHRHSLSARGHPETYPPGDRRRPQPAIRRARKACQHCGQPASDPGARFCWFCGQALPTTQAPPSGSMTETRLVPDPGRPRETTVPE